MRLPLLSLMLLLAACAQTRQSCEANVLREIRRLDELIVETRRDLARGYTYERELRPPGPAFGTGLTFCSGGDGVSFCTTTGTGLRDRVVERREAIDPRAEQRTLDYLEARRARLAQEGAAACAAAHPES